MNLIPGFYWVQQYESTEPTIARLTKGSGWEYFYSQHSTKAMKNSPYRVLSKKLEVTDEQKVL